MRIDLQSKELGSISQPQGGFIGALVQGGAVLHHPNMAGHTVKVEVSGRLPRARRSHVMARINKWSVPS